MWFTEVMENNIENFESKLSLWVAAVQGMITKSQEELVAKGFAPTVVLVERGPKYARIVRFSEQTVGGKKETVERSAYAFIDLATGDVLKPAGWKGPAKHARGNILDGTGLKSVTPYGIQGMR